MRSRQSETLRLFILAAILAALALWRFSAGLSSQAPAKIGFGRRHKLGHDGADAGFASCRG